MNIRLLLQGVDLRVPISYASSHSFTFQVPNRLSFVSAAVIEAALAAFRGKVDPDHLGIILWPQFEAQAKVIPFTQRAQQG